MTKDEVLQMAIEAGVFGEVNDGLERFAVLVAAKAAADENEACALICDEMQLHYSAYADTALLNGNVELSIAASGEPRACEFIAKTIRARHNTQKRQEK